MLTDRVLGDTKMRKSFITWSAVVMFLSNSGLAVARDVQTDNGDTALSSAQIETPSVPLWRGLIAGSDVNAVIAVLQALPEIKEAEARLKKGKPPEIKLKYNSEGLTLFGFRLKLGFNFENSSLSEVFLNSESVCNGVPYENSLTKLFEGLLEKYPKKLKVVNSDGTEAQNSFAFTDGVTQVTLVVRGSMPPSGYDVASANLEATLAEAKQSYDALTKRLHASQLERTRNYALMACPASEGIMRSIALVYSSRAQEVVAQIQDQNRKEEANRRDSEKL